MREYKNRRATELYRKMLEAGNWPKNDCQVYMNIGRMAFGVADDLEKLGDQLSKTSRMAMEHRFDDLFGELERMYYDNAAIRAWKSGECRTQGQYERRLGGAKRVIE